MSSYIEMKILLFYTYNQSFLAAFFNELALSLQERGWQVQVFSFKNEASVLEEPLRVDIKQKKHYFKNSVEIYKAIRKYKPDVIISNFSYVNAAVLSAWLFRVKKNIVWSHTLTDQLEASRFNIFRKSIFLKIASGIIVNSNKLKVDLETNYNINSDKIYPIPFWSGLENDVVNRKKIQIENVKIGVPGRIEKVKNQQIVIDLLLEYRRDLGKTKWNFAGSGNDEERLKDQIRKNKLENSIEFLGVLGIKEMRRFYNQMDVIILPSKFESFGLVLIEALSMNCPVLVSEKFGALNYIDDEDFLNRYTFNPHDVMDLKAKFDRLLLLPPESNQYFKDIYLRFFKKEEIIDSVEKIIN